MLSVWMLSVLNPVIVLSLPNFRKVYDCWPDSVHWELCAAVHHLRKMPLCLVAARGRSIRVKLKQYFVLKLSRTVFW